MKEKKVLVSCIERLRNMGAYGGIISATFLFVLSCEFLYSSSSGAHSAVVLILLFLIGAGLMLLSGKRPEFRDFICAAVSFIVLVYTRNEESIRYALLLATAVLWMKIRYKRLDLFAEALIVLNSIFVLVQWIMGTDRVHGVFANSPTQMACMILICEIYLLVIMNNRGFSLDKMLCAFLCVLATYLTGTRSVFLASVLGFVGYILITLINYLPKERRKRATLILLVVAAIVLVVALPWIIDILNTKLNRNNATESLMTRQSIYIELLSECFSNIGTVLFGNRGGYVQDFLKQHFNSSSYFPGHQDYLVLLCEYGILGFGVLVAALFAGKKNWLYFGAVFTVCSFHNIILNPMAMVLMFITMQDLDNQGYSVLFHERTLAKMQRLQFRMPKLAELKRLLCLPENKGSVEEQEKRNLFLVMTPAQLLNAAAIANSEFEGKKCDIYYTENMSSQARELVQLGVFNAGYQVALVEDLCERNSVLKRALVRIKNALDISKIEKGLPSDPNLYKCVFASGVSLRNFEIYYAIKRKNLDVKFNLYEEGICEYYYFAKKDWPKILFSYLFFGRFYVDDCQKLYVYSPDMVSIAWKKIQICQIPEVKTIPGLLEKINRGFAYEPTELSSGRYKCIILEQQFDGGQSEEQQMRMIQGVIQRIGVENVLIKMHPRSPMTKYGEELTCLKTPIPFEVIAMNEAVDDLTFISVASSSVLNLNLMLHIEPNIFALMMIGKPEKDDYSESEKLFLRVQGKCVSGNFYIPRTEEEFFERLESII